MVLIHVFPHSYLSQRDSEREGRCLNYQAPGVVTCVKEALSNYSRMESPVWTLWAVTKEPCGVEIGWLRPFRKNTPRIL